MGPFCTARRPRTCMRGSATRSASIGPVLRRRPYGWPASRRSRTSTRCFKPSACPRDSRHSRRRTISSSSRRRRGVPSSILNAPRSLKQFARSSTSFSIAPACPRTPDGAFQAVRRMANNSRRERPEARRLQNNLAARLDGVRDDALYAKVLFLFLGAPGVVLAALVTVAIARAGRARRMREQALMRIRGATLLETLANPALEAAVVGLSRGRGGFAPRLYRVAPNGRERRRANCAFLGFVRGCGWPRVCSRSDRGSCRSGRPQFDGGPDSGPCGDGDAAAVGAALARYSAPRCGGARLLERAGSWLSDRAGDRGRGADLGQLRVVPRAARALGGAWSFVGAPLAPRPDRGAVGSHSCPATDRQAISRRRSPHRCRARRRALPTAPACWRSPSASPFRPRRSTPPTADRRGSTRS